MVARHVRPGPPLGEFIDCLWYFDGYHATHARERALPTGTAEIVLNLKDDCIRVFQSDRDFTGNCFRGAVVCGSHPGYFVIEPSQQQEVIGVHFKPGGAAPFLGAPAGEFTSQNLDLEDIWPASITRSLRARLVEAVSPETKLRILEQALVSRLKPRLTPHPTAAFAIRRLLAAPAITRIGSMQQASGFSPKRFIQLFRDASGLSPKVFCRIQRFQTVITQIARGERIEWAEVAVASGYYDQPHLNREFRSFSGLSPAEYRPVAPDRPNHVAI